MALSNFSTVPAHAFVDRHLGPDAQETATMLQELEVDSLEQLMDAVIPADIRLQKDLQLPTAATEADALQELRTLASRNKVFRSLIGQGYYNTYTPPVIQRNVLENPGWYTSYTPYQAEISQGRLEALLNFQTMVADLTGLEIANASLLDEATAAAEAMTMALRHHKNKDANRFLVSSSCHPQTIEVLRTRALPLDIEVVVCSHTEFTFCDKTFAALVQYPDTHGKVEDFEKIGEAIHAAGGLLIVATDLLALTLLRSPGEFGADIAIGNSQRFGVPLGFGGPHAAFFATREVHKRSMPGRVIGVSKDAHGRPGLRLAMQTREQHIRRDKATSNICTAQALLAVMASMYAVYHGPEGLKAIAQSVHLQTLRLAQALLEAGIQVDTSAPVFDTLVLSGTPEQIAGFHANAKQHQTNLRHLSETSLSVALDETVTDLTSLLAIFGVKSSANTLEISEKISTTLHPFAFSRTSEYLTHPIFNKYHSETLMLRYMRKLESRDLSLTQAMIPLGSCTMKLNATSQMYPISWPEFASIHPFAPLNQAEGYLEMLSQLESWLSEITGFAATSLQPNAGSQGEYSGLLAIRGYHLNKGDAHRNVCLIPQSAHGTNPASAVMAGMKVVPVVCDTNGNIDVSDLEKKAEQFSESLAAAMITYPSTHGVFETTIRQICEIIHSHGGQVYLDGANMNAQVGVCRPGDYGADVCHLNLHKTFCIPHGGGGPGVGPICVASHLIPFLPGHETVNKKSETGAISATHWGSAGILVIPWMYIRTMGADGLLKATQLAILNANYIAKRLDPYFPVLYRGAVGFVAHECIVDLRPYKASTDVEVEDVAKRLMDYGYHAPTMSWPVVGTLMIEPTESESKEELDRFCDAMISIHQEIQDIQHGKADKVDNALKNAPHPAADLVEDNWPHAYSRKQAAYPTPWNYDYKFWPVVSRIDNVYGDRNLICSCPPMEDFS